MKKITLFSFAVIAFFLFLVLALSLYISFAKIKPASEKINQKLEEHFSKIVRIPKGIQRPIYNFDETSYFWEMETNQGEVIGVNFKFDTGFSKKTGRIIATLEMPEKGDASIFNKVLPSLVSDKQSLDSAIDIEKANLGANDAEGYNQIKILALPSTKQAVKISWEFDKEKLPSDIRDLYRVINTYPDSLARKLYSLPKFIFDLLSG